MLHRVIEIKPRDVFSEMEKIEYRAHIKTRALFGISATNIANELSLAHGHNAPPYSTVTRWTALFKAGREHLEDDPRSGRPITSFTESSIDLIQDVICTNPHATCHY